MNVVEWRIRGTRLPELMKPCVDCSSKLHRPSGKFRMNANGKLLDVWLLVFCAKCGRTSKVAIHERVPVAVLGNERIRRYESNDSASIATALMDQNIARRNNYRLDWEGAWCLEVQPLASCGGHVLVRFEVPVPIRPVKILMRGLALSRGKVVEAVGSGLITMPIDVNAKASSDFEFRIAPALPVVPGTGGRDAGA
ncbi:DUF1062 domain-containing protein [Nonomuraea sp. NPDC050643]|uniref:DUF1062 domain-containing protein n=1 Tax=Nonomuraea sp. NPDC050643 TaxID=3155660 RepID=UPI0033F6E24E